MGKPPARIAANPELAQLIVGLIFYVYEIAHYFVKKCLSLKAIPRTELISIRRDCPCLCFINNQLSQLALSLTYA